MNPNQLVFLEQQFISMSIMATALRGNLYRKDANKSEKEKDYEREKFRCDLGFELKRLTEQYRRGISESAHITNISRLADDMSVKHAKALNKGRFRVGSAQKALNLYLKYMWCMGEISTPPHCPFDAIILSYIPDCLNVRWTKLDSLPEYEKIVQCAKSVADGISLAEWELSQYNTAISS